MKRQSILLEAERLKLILSEQYRTFKRESKAMARAVDNCYPVGTKLQVIHATRQDGPDIIATVVVIAAPTWYSSPEMLRCRYYYGSKVRDFSFTDIVAVTGLPDKGENEL